MPDDPQPRPRVALFVTCLADAIRRAMLEPG
jgi:hypothetical protein